MKTFLIRTLTATLSTVLTVFEMAAAEPVQFVEEIQPILETHCISCHGPEKQEGGLRLDAHSFAVEGGDRGPAIVAGDVETSLLVTAITFRSPDLQMPPRKKLTDQQIQTLTHWVKQGAHWPQAPQVLFEDRPEFLSSLNSGNGRGRIITYDAFSGTAALGITPLQRDGVKIPGWQFAIRERPKAGEYRYLRLAWKKKGEGSVMIELASNGQWPDAKSPKGRYVAGPNTTGWAAISVGDTAPSKWTVQTFDLWKDIGDFVLTGIAPTCDKGEEAYFDSILLAPSIDSLNSYRAAKANPEDLLAISDAWSDRRNPIRKLFRGDRLDLWSLKVPAQVTPPDSPTDAGISRSSPDNPIDRFVDLRLRSSGLSRSSEADRRTLIRRLSLDLSGLPPSADEVNEFLADQSEGAYERQVERLLASPHYGERQARLWLDVVRYADTNGYERDEFRPLAWQYRDYVIRSFNQDKPFDQLIREQLAGDELVTGPPANQAEIDMLLATGFLRLGQWDSTASIFQEDERLRAEQMADLTNTTASAFLGLTMSCCQCHDHKYDPFSQADHFRLRAFFAGTTARDDLSISLKSEQVEIDQHNAELERQLAPLKQEQAKLDKSNTSRAEELKKQIEVLEAKRRAPQRAMGAMDSGANPPATFLLYQGDYSAPREEVLPGFVSVLHPGPAAIQRPRENTSGRRLALANWIASAKNPWTARVIVNRIWQQHFGVGLVATPNDLGFSGTRPTHPDLLDWLALEFVRQGWSVKQLHRLIVTSATYRQSSSGHASQGLQQTSNPHPDPDNTLLWRQNLRRLDAETLRDSLLFVSGRLQDVPGGKPRWPEVPEELKHAQPAILEAEKGGDGGRMQGWYTDPVDQTDVRSIYLVRKRCLPIPFLQAFDLPDSSVSCARRDSTVVAPQALMLLNSPEGLRYAGALAQAAIDRLSRDTHPGQADATHHALRLDDENTRTALIRDLFETTLQRIPDADEMSLSSSLLDRTLKQHQEAGQGDQSARLAVTDLCRALLNLNEFIYVD